MKRGSKLQFDFDIWGCRGSRSLPPGASRVGTLTSCYSLLLGEDIVVFDAGRGLVSLSHAVLSDQRFQRVRRVHLFISHGHMDHWEGLKDAEWLWAPETGIEVVIHSTGEALRSIESAHEPPSFVRLDVLALGSLKSISFAEIGSGQRIELPDCRIETAGLHHYSGMGTERLYLDTLGFRVEIADGPSLAYLCDHEPTADTRATEDLLLQGTSLAVLDAHWADISEHTFGHGSQEYAAAVARRTPNAMVLATHHGAAAEDAQIEAAHTRHGSGLDNFAIAREGDRYLWRDDEKRYRRR